MLIGFYILSSMVVDGVRIAGGANGILILDITYKRTYLLKIGIASTGIQLQTFGNVPVIIDVCCTIMGIQPVDAAEVEVNIPGFRRGAGRCKRMVYVVDADL